MRILPRRTRGNALLAAISFSVVGCYVIAFSILVSDDDIRSHDDMDAIALAKGGKMKLLPAEGHNFKHLPHADIEEDINIETEHAEKRRPQSHRHIDKVVDRPPYYDDGDEDGDDDEIEKEAVVVKKNERNDIKERDTFLGDFHRIIAENKEKLIVAVDDTNKKPKNHLSGNFLSYNRRQVQNCITHTIYGNIPANVHTQPLKVQNISSPESANIRKQSFKKVFDDRSWGKGWDKAYDRLDASGRGATLSWSQEVIATLHSVINDLKIALGKSKIRILDLPCGDMAWMSRFLVTRDDVEYTGIDIVPELINNHRKAYRSYPWKFRLVDILEHPLEESFDLIINRMMLQHLYYADALKILKQFSDSNSIVLISTSFMRTEVNTELDMNDNPGRVHKLNLGLPPIALTPPLCLVRDGPPDTFEGWDHFIGVWELPLRIIPNCVQAKALTLKGTDKTIYSCVNWSLDKL